MTKAEKIVEAIIKDFTDRRGLGQEWEQIDDDIQQDIKSEWIRIVKELL